jgi:hypothetical protein
MSNARVLWLAMATASVVLGSNTMAVAQHDMPPGMTHEQHMAQLRKQAEMKKRGNAAMGFDQDETTHHFLLSPNGGSIQVEVNDNADTASRDAIRSHLKSISEQFTNGDFSAPFATHNETIPGVATMQRLKSKIQYGYEEKPGGGVVRIQSKDRSAIEAVHSFLQYQINEHATGDPSTVAK